MSGERPTNGDWDFKATDRSEALTEELDAIAKPRKPRTPAKFIRRRVVAALAAAAALGGGAYVGAQDGGQERVASAAFVEKAKVPTQDEQLRSPEVQQDICDDLADLKIDQEVMWATGSFRFAKGEQIITVVNPIYAASGEKVSLFCAMGEDGPTLLVADPEVGSSDNKWVEVGNELNGEALTAGKVSALMPDEPSIVAQYGEGVNAGSKQLGAIYEGRNEANAAG